MSKHTKNKKGKRKINEIVWVNQIFYRFACLLMLVLLISIIMNLQQENLTFQPEITGSYAIDITGNLILEISGSSVANTQLNVTNDSINAPPILVANIPNITFEEDTNTSLNLSAYFTNPLGNGLNYTFTPIANLTVSLNNATGNVTFIPEINFRGIRHITFTAYNSKSNTTSNNITLNVSASYNITMNNFDGTSTRMDTYANAQLQNMADVILEMTSYGEIHFTESVTIQRDINIDKLVRMSSNSILMQTEIVLELNKTAILTMYGVSFTDPQILIDGAICSASICQEVNYSGATYVFETPFMANYTLRETPVTSTPAPTPVSAGGGEGGGGGGGGAAISEPDLFELNISTLSVTMRQGENKREKFTIINTGDKFLDFVIDTASLGKFIELSQYNLTLPPQASETIEITFFISPNKEPKIHKDMIKVTADRRTKSIAVTLDIRKKGAIVIDTDIEDAGLKPEFELPGLIFDIRYTLLIIIIILLLVLLLFILFRERKK